MKFTFEKASKSQLKARVAISGPAGSGKTTAALTLARELVPDGTVAVIDTERGSASLYADRFDFLTLDFAPPYDPARLTEAIDAAASAGVNVLIIDSLSHFWSGEGGLLEQVDSVSGNKFANGWKDATPKQNRMVEKILSFPGHVIVTLRSKAAYVVEQDGRGKAVPKKVGQAPIQREGLEYEFSLVLDLDRDHSIGISKTRCAELETTSQLPASDLHRVFETFIAWLSEGEVATTSASQAKRLLLKTFEDRGWVTQDARDHAAAMWADAGFTGDRVPVAELDELIKAVPRKAPEADPFAVEQEEGWDAEAEAVSA